MYKFPTTTMKSHKHTHAHMLVQI